MHDSILFWEEAVNLRKLTSFMSNSSAYIMITELKKIVPFLERRQRSASERYSNRKERLFASCSLFRLLIAGILFRR